MVGNSEESACKKFWSLRREALAQNHKRHWRHTLWHHWQLGSGTTLQPRRIWLGTHLTQLHIGLLEDPPTKQATSCFHSWQLLTEELVSNLDTCRLLENRNETPKRIFLGDYKLSHPHFHSWCLPCHYYLWILYLEAQTKRLRLRD